MFGFRESRFQPSHYRVIISSECLSRIRICVSRGKVIGTNPGRTSIWNKFPFWGGRDYDRDTKQLLRRTAGLMAKKCTQYGGIYVDGRGVRRGDRWNAHLNKNT